MPVSLVLATASSVVIGLLSWAPGAAATAIASERCAAFEVVAHRGYQPPGVDENTVAAFREASESGFSIETDVRSDADGALWMFHDRSTWRLTGVRGFIDEMTTAEVADLRYSDNGHRITTFERALDQWTSTPSTRVFVEVKLVEDVSAVADQIRQAGRIESTFVTSWTPYTHRTAPDIRTLYKMRDSAGAPEPSTATDLGADVVAIAKRYLTRSRVAEFQAAGLEVQGYKSNLRSAWAITINSGADGQLTDTPKRLRRYCRQYTSPPRITKVVAAEAGTRTVTIRGRHLGTARTVRFSGVRARQFVAAPRQIHVRLPQSVGRVAKVKVVTPAGTDVTSRLRVRRR